MIETTAYSDEIWCATCGYSLEGLEADSLCPECGGAATTHSNPLSLYTSHAGYLERLSFGIATMVMAGVAACALATIYAVNWSMGNRLIPPNPTFSALTILVVGAALAAGLRLFSSKEWRGPGNVGRSYWASVIRWGSTIALVCAACFVPGILIGFHGLLVWPGLIGAAALAAAWLASTAHGAALAARTPDHRLVMIFENLHAVIVVLALVGSCFFLIGPIVALGLWCWVFSRLWLRVGQARRSAAP